MIDKKAEQAENAWKQIDLGKKTYE